MDFYDMLQNKGMVSLLHRVNYYPVKFVNQECILNFFDNLLGNLSKRVLVYGDYDVDGAMFSMTTLSFLSKLGVKHVEVFKYRKRTHELDKEAVRYCIQNKFDYFIIGDTASSELDTLHMLVSYGVKVFVIDHHLTNYDYRDFQAAGVPIINSTIENVHLKENKFMCSAGALAFLVYDSYLASRNMTLLDSESVFALISLYADCMNMTNLLNRSLYYKAVELNRPQMPKHVLHFMNEYQTLSARFIGFWFSPRINALFRSENFDILNSYLFDDLSASERIALIERINTVYTENRKMVGLLSDLVEVDVLDHFVICNLRTADEKKPNTFINMQNYTGLVANRLADRFGKTAVVYTNEQDHFKGSVRDPYSRSYLAMFQQLCNAGGHGAAFGFFVKPFELKTFLNRLETIDQYFHIDDAQNEPIIIDHNYIDPDEGLIEDVALYNEFSGSHIPIVYLRKQIIGGMTMKQTSYYYKYDWGNYFVQSDYPIEFGKYVLIKPIKGIRTKLLAQV